MSGRQQRETASLPSTSLRAGPDSINWSALWSRWQSVWLRAVLVVPLLAAVILFPIGAFTGALSNLNLSLCGGTPGELAVKACLRVACVRLGTAALCIDAHCAPSFLPPLLHRAETNSMYWGWYCEATDFWEGVVKELIQGTDPQLPLAECRGGEPCMRCAC